MATDTKSKLRKLQAAKREFVMSAKQVAAKLGRECDRLETKLNQINARIKRTQIQVKSKAERLAAASKSSADKSRKELESQLTKLKKALTAARAEARKTRDELTLVGKDLVDARHHLSIALHIDKAMVKIEQMIAKRKVARKRAA